MTQIVYPGNLAYILGPTATDTGTAHDVFMRNESLFWAQEVMNTTGATLTNRLDRFQQYGPAGLLREFYRGGSSTLQSAFRRVVESHRDNANGVNEGIDRYNPTMLQNFCLGTGPQLFFPPFNNVAADMFAAYVLNNPSGEAAATRKCRDIVKFQGAGYFQSENLETPFNQWGHGVRETGSGLGWNLMAILLGDGNTVIPNLSRITGQVVNRTPNEMLEIYIQNLVQHDQARDGWWWDLESGSRYVGNQNLAGTTLERLIQVDWYKRTALNQVDSRLTNLINRGIAWLDTQWVPLGQDEIGGVGELHQGGAWRYYFYENGNYAGNGVHFFTLYPLGGHLIGPYAYKFLRDGTAFHRQTSVDAEQCVINGVPVYGSGSHIFDARQYSEASKTWHLGMGWIDIALGEPPDPPDPPDPPSGSITLTGAATVQGGAGLTTPLTATVTESAYIACRFTLISGPGITSPIPMDPEIFGSGQAPNPYVFNWNLSPAFTPAGTYQITATARRNSSSGAPTLGIPTIEGWGATTVGGTGGDVHVTNLNDSGAGSLRNALQAGTGTANRRIVFDVGGTITGSTDIFIGFNSLTIDGDTAPTPITLQGFGIVIQDRSQIIIRKLRIRNAAPEDGISLVGPGAHHIVIDRVSISGADDSSIDINGGCQDITIQWCILSSIRQSLIGQSGTPDPQTERISYRNNALIGSNNPAEEYDRFPLIRPNNYVPTNMTIDIRNNIFMGWVRANGTKIENTARVNLVNNYYIPSTATSFAHRQGSVQIATPSLAYVAGNVEQHDAPTVDYNTGYGSKAEAWPVPATTTHDALTAAQLVVANAGVVPRDAKDTELLSRFSVPGSTGGPITSAPLTIVVTDAPIPPPTQPVLAVSPATISLTGPVGTTPLTAVITITNVGTGTLNWTASETVPWADLSATSGVAPAVTTLTVNPTGLPAGVQQGAVTITAPGANGSPVAIPVTLTLTAVEPPDPPVQPVLSVSPASLSFNDTHAGPVPDQTLTVINTGQTGTLNWTAAVTVSNPGSPSQAPSITIDPTSGATPGTITVSMVPQALSATNTITVTAPGAQGSPVSIPVLVTVNAPPIQVIEPKTGWVVAGSLALVALVSQGGV